MPAEYDGLLPQDTELAQQTNVPDVFGATTEDTQGMRIVSLYEVCCHACNASLAMAMPAGYELNVPLQSCSNQVAKWDGTSPQAVAKICCLSCL